LTLAFGSTQTPENYLNGLGTQEFKNDESEGDVWKICAACNSADDFFYEGL